MVLLSKADEMLEHLGYIKQYENDGNIYYYIDVICKDDYICFDLGRKTYTKRVCYHDAGEITIEELQAINEKVKELGWLDEQSAKQL